MTLDWSKTADDDTLVHTLLPLLAGRIWHDGRHWWATDTTLPFTQEEQGTGRWVRTTMTHMLWRHLAQAATQLPDTDYWARSRHRLRMVSSMYVIARRLEVECFLNRLPKPDGIPAS